MTLCVVPFLVYSYAGPREFHMKSPSCDMHDHIRIYWRCADSLCVFGLVSHVPYVLDKVHVRAPYGLENIPIRKPTVTSRDCRCGARTDFRGLYDYVKGHTGPMIVREIVVRAPKS